MFETSDKNGMSWIPQIHVSPPWNDKSFTRTLKCILFCQTALKYITIPLSEKTTLAVLKKIVKKISFSVAFKGCHLCLPKKMLSFENFSLIAHVTRGFSFEDIDITSWKKIWGEIRYQRIVGNFFATFVEFLQQI